MIKECKNCNKEFKTYPSKIKLGRGIYCSKECTNLSFKGKHFSPKTEVKKGNILSKLTLFKKGQEAWNKGVHYQVGENNSQWKGGLNKHVAGYIVQRIGINKRELQHRKIMEDYLGRKLSSDEIVHHIDHDKTNNSIENLQIVTRSEHINMHRKDLQWQVMM